MKDYDTTRYKGEMAKIMHSLWGSNIGTCPLSPTELESLEWEKMSVYMPVIYFSHLGDVDKFKDLSKIASAGIRIKQVSEAYQVVEMMTDIGLLSETTINIDKGHPPMVESWIMFPSIHDLDGIEQDTYRLLIGTSVLGWIRVYMMDAFRKDLHNIAHSTMLELESNLTNRPAPDEINSAIVH